MAENSAISDVCMKTHANVGRFFCEISTLQVALGAVLLKATRLHAPAVQPVLKKKMSFGVRTTLLKRLINAAIPELLPDTSNDGVEALLVEVLALRQMRNELAHGNIEMRSDGLLLVSGFDIVRDNSFDQNRFDTILGRIAKARRGLELLESQLDRALTDRR